MPDQRARTGALRPLAAAAAQRGRSDGGGVLPVRRSTGNIVAGAGAGGWPPLGHRRVFRAGKGRLRSGRVRGAFLDRLAPARDAQPVRTGDTDGHPRAAVPPARVDQARVDQARVARTCSNGRRNRKKGGPGLIPLTVPEVRKLLLRLIWYRLHDAGAVLAWSAWRRRHQHRARIYHYRKRKALPPQMTIYDCRTKAVRHFL